MIDDENYFRLQSGRASLKRLHVSSFLNDVKKPHIPRNVASSFQVEGTVDVKVVIK